MENTKEDACMPIAVIGMGCRFPGDATSPEHLWELLENGRSAWSTFPRDRINIDGFYHPSSDRQGSICFKGGHFLRDNIAAFDAPFFSTTAHEASAMDPQQRILLEVSYEAFENAGIPIENLPGSLTGVYCGSFVKDYEQICLRDPDNSPQYAATGNGIAIMSNRISWFYDLRGPSMTLDTGCSASLVGVHLACQSLRAGESTLAIAMGAGLILTPATMLPMTALNFLSPDGKCFAFDERANGYGRGEGIGAVILKPLAAALRDNDTIRAIIRGSGINQDGRTPGITMPSKEAQAMNIRAVYKAAGLGYDRTAYFEAHGTGTQAGDPTELGAISETFAETRNKDSPIFVGSVKTNIGHLEGCAGIAGLCKSVLMLEKGLIPTNLYFENVNSRIPLEDWKIKIPQCLTPWPMDGLRRVSVNCFGFGGTNAHLILDDAFNYMSERGIIGNHTSANLSLPTSPSTTDSWVYLRNPSEKCVSHWTSKTPMQLYVLSAHEESGVLRLSSQYAEYLTKRNISNMPGQDAVQTGSNLAYTLGIRRTKLPWKAFLVSSSPENLSSAFLEQLSTPNRASQAPNISFVFNGQGAQWYAMGRELLEYHIFEDCLNMAETYLRSLGCEWSLMSELLKDAEVSLIDLPRISQPLCTALQIALVDLLGHWGVEPQAVVGHSSGEIAAAYALGALTREDAWKLSYHRGRLTSAMKFLAPNLRGRMMAVALSTDEMQKYLANLKEGIAIIACINSPESVTISGDEFAVLELQNLLKHDGIFARLLKVDNAYHSHHMKIIEHHYLQSIKGLQPLAAKLGRKMVSSVTGEVINSSDLGPYYWAQNLVSPVKFLEALTSLLRSKGYKPDIILEIGPHAALQGPIKQILDATLKTKSKPISISILYRGKDAISTSLSTAGYLWTLGTPIDLNKVNTSKLSPEVSALTDLPPYPWNHTKTYWHESHLGSAHRFRKWGRQDLIGAQTADSIPEEPRWRGFIRVSENPWVKDHQVQNTIIYPAAGMISMALEAARQLEDEERQVQTYEVYKMHIYKAMIVPTSLHGLEMALNAKVNHTEAHQEPRRLLTFSFTIYSKPHGSRWIKHAHGNVKVTYKDQLSIMDLESDRVSTEKHRSRYNELKETCVQRIPPRQLYESLESIGMKYGPTFQNIVSIQKKDNTSCHIIRIPDTASGMPAKYEYPHLIHPATLDAIFQTAFVAGNEPMVPSFLETLCISSDFPRGARHELLGYSSASRHGLQDAKSTVVMSNSSWKKPLIVISDLYFTAISKSATNTVENGFLPNNHKLCAQLEWKEDVNFSKCTLIEEWLHLLAFKNLDLNILEIHEGITLHMESILTSIDRGLEATPRVARYTVAGTDAASFEKAQNKLPKWSGHMSWKSIDNKEEITRKGFKLKSFDLIITQDGGQSFIASLSSLLKPEGYILQFQHSEHVTPGGSVDIDVIQYRIVHRSRNPSASFTAICEEKSGESHLLEEDSVARVISTPLTADTLACRDVILVMPECASPTLERLSVRIIAALRINRIRAQITTFPISPEILTGNICVSFVELESPILFNFTKPQFEAFRSIINMSKGCLWVTKGGHVDCENPPSSIASSLCRTIRSEDPQKLIFNLDLDPITNLDSDNSSRAILYTILRSFRSGTMCNELEYAERGGKILIPRVKLQQQLSSRIERGDSRPSSELLPYFQPGRPLKLEVGHIGDLNSLYFNDDIQSNSPLEALDIEIKVVAAAVNICAVKTALGQISNDTIGTDASGIITRIGSEVTKFKPGDRVLTLVSGSFKYLIRTTELMCQLIPDSMSIETTASLPGDLVLAYYSLITVGRLEKGEFVLIHNAASSMGQIAIQISQYIGAEVFATFLDNKEKEILTSSLGLNLDHVFEADSGEITDAILGFTRGKGVDIILNVPSQHKTRHNWNSISSFGRFIEFTGNDCSELASLNIYQNIRNITYSRVDLDAIIRGGKIRASHIFELAFELVRDGNVKVAKGLSICPISEIVDSFKYAQNGIQVVVKMDDNDLVPVVPRDEHPIKLESDATYVLVGGLGGLGRSLAGLLIKHGARNLAFFSRSGAVSDDQIKFVAGLARQEIRCQVYKCDITIKSQLTEVIQQCMRDMPRIRGVIQGAAVIRDSIFDNMTYEDWVIATEPKIQGSWNLHEAMPSDLDFFIFLSSSAAVIGARGQANYASGNAFQDSLAQYRRCHGQAAVSLDLGPILGVGMVAEDDATADILKASGFFGVREKDFHLIILAAITGYSEDGSLTPSQVIIATGTGGLVKQNQVSDPYWYREARFSHMKFIDLAPQLSNSSDKASMEELLTACSSFDEAAGIVLEGLTSLLAKSMNMLPVDLDTRKAASAYGVDSLVAVGMRNWIFRETGVDVSIFEILSEVAIEDLVVKIARNCRFLAPDLLSVEDCE